jgi:hypothetical protein
MLPIFQGMGRPPRQSKRKTRARGSYSYELIVRGPDGRPRLERFENAASYRAKLIGLQRSPRLGVSIEDIAKLLDV